MEFEEALKELKQGKEILNENWNGLHQKGRIMYLKLQSPDENSMNTEPYIVMVSGNCDNGGWVFKKFPWTPSCMDLFSDKWRSDDRALKKGD